MLGPQARRLIDRVLNEEEFQRDPPLLVDVGASGAIHPDWQALAPYSVCVAFDADARDFDPGKTSVGYRQLHVFNCLVSDVDSGETDFFLTRSPYCSSSLPPDTDHLAAWSFWELFDVERIARLPSRSLSSVLAELGVDHVDWFKTDSQGIDLRLFRSLGTDLIERVLVADFEPGMIDAYVGEDKLAAVLACMDALPFWISDLAIQGSRRMSKELARLFADRINDLELRVSPGWAEISYLNTFGPPPTRTRRNLLLGWVLSTLKQQHGFALELVLQGRGVVGEPLGSELSAYSESVLFPPRRPLSRRAIGKVIRSLEKLEARQPRLGGARSGRRSPGG